MDAPDGGRFCVLTRPPGPPVGGMLFVPPFAEELNKSRRMVALAARAFAEQGWMTLQMDHFGCGDSAGEFSQATWQHWIDDVESGWRWLKGRCDAPLALWTLRAGSLLASAWLEAAGERAAMLMWQPVVSGRQHLNQFLRLKAAAQMLADADARTAMARARQDLANGAAVSVAGYTVHPELARGLDAAALHLRTDHDAPVLMLEVSGVARAGASPALEALAERIRAAGAPAVLESVSGPAFWQTLEIETAGSLIDRSVQLLEHLH